MMGVLLAMGIAIGWVLTQPTTAHGETPAPTSETTSETDSERLFSHRIESVANTCANCHGTAGRLTTEIPPLAGKPAPVLEALMLAFRSDRMPHATVMPRLMKGYTTEEITAIAEYFAALPAD